MPRLREIRELIEQSFDYVKEHGHDRCEVGDILWFFHNYEHGYAHCSGPASNPYEIQHVTKDGEIQHGISLPKAVGHGINRERTWFSFSEKVEPGWYWLEKGKEIKNGKSS